MNIKELPVFKEEDKNTYLVEIETDEFIDIKKIQLKAINHPMNSDKFKLGIILEIKK